MTAEVKALKIAEKPVDAELVQHLEEALAEAKSGEMTGVLMLAQEPDGTCSYSVVGIHDRFRVTGYLFKMLHRLQYDNGQG